MIAHKLFALYAATLIALSSIPPAQAATSGATTTVSSFYRWYFANKTDWTRLAGARQYLTPSLYAALKKVLDEQQREGAAILDFDPFIGAQERAESYEAGAPSGAGTRQSVPVRLRYEHSSRPGTINAIVVNGPGGWKIDDFVYPGMGDLRSTIASAMKSG